VKLFKPTTEARFDEMLGAVPPILFDGHKFLVGEAWSLRQCRVSGQTRNTYQAFLKYRGAYYESVGDMTVAEFRSINPAKDL
jgi:hypothetical protein